MVAPASFSTADLTGSFVINKQLSDSLQSITLPQRPGVDVRKLVLSRVPVSTKVKHYKSADGVEHFDVENTNNNGKTRTRTRVLSGDNKSAKIKDHAANISTQKVNVSTLASGSLKEGWDASAISSGVISTVVTGADAAWSFQVVLGISTINGEKRLVRKIHAKGPNGKSVQARIVYDYAGAN